MAVESQPHGSSDLAALCDSSEAILAEVMSARWNNGLAMRGRQVCPGA